MIYPDTNQQVIVLLGVTICGFTDGFIFGQMSGMLSTLQKEKEMDISDEAITWIASIINVMCFVGYIIGNIVNDYFGRRKAIIIMTIPVIISWITVYFSTGTALLIISRIAAGISFGGVLMTSAVCTSEYMTPQIRGFSVCLMHAVAPAVGTGVGHILAIIIHWRTVALIGIVPSVLSLIITYFWVESPSWLASQGRFQECEKVFKLLRKWNETAEKELRLLIDLETSKLSKSKNSQTKSFYKFIAAFRKRYFLKILAIVAVIAVYRAASLKILFNTFALTIVQDITGSPDILLFTMVVDSFIVTGTILASVLSNKYKLRKIILPTSCISIFLLVSLSAGLYFDPGNNIYFSWINCLLLALYFITVYISTSTLEIYNTEILPLEIKPALFGFLAIINGILIFLSIKYAPFFFVSIGYYGLFFSSAILLSLCLVILWIYLPETRGRTLQEIELYFKTKSFDRTGELLVNQDQIKNLI